MPGQSPRAPQPQGYFQAWTGAMCTAANLLWGCQENSEAASENSLCKPSGTQKHYYLAANSLLLPAPHGRRGCQAQPGESILPSAPRPRAELERRAPVPCSKKNQELEEEKQRKRKLNEQDLCPECSETEPAALLRVENAEPHSLHGHLPFCQPGRGLQGT